MSRNQRGGVKSKPNYKLNALPRRMGTLRFGKKTKPASRLGTKSNRRKTLKKRSVLKVVSYKPKKPVKTLRTFVKGNLSRRKNQPFHMEQFEPAEYIRKVGGLFKNLGQIRARIETGEKAHYLDDFDMILLKLYEGLPTIQTVLGISINESMNGSEETIDTILEAIEQVGERLVQQANSYRRQLSSSRSNLSNIQIHLIAVAEAVNQVLVQSVSEVARNNTNQDMSDLLGKFEQMNIKESSVDELTFLLEGLGL